MHFAMNTSLAVGIGVGVAIGWVLRGRTRTILSLFMKPSVKPAGKSAGGAPVLDPTDSCPTIQDSGEYKMVLVVRMDLKMGKGKIAAQCAHAAVGAVHKCSRTDPATLQTWRMFGQPKVVVKADDENMLNLLAEAAKVEGLITSIIRDAGRTQIAAGSTTVLAVGPGPAHVIDTVTGHLKLL